MTTPALQDHPEYTRIAAAAVRLFDDGVMVRVRETVYRAAKPEYSELPDLISGLGSKLVGSRWNPPGAMRVLHASDTPEDAISECFAGYRRHNLPLPSTLHIVVRAVHCDVQRVLDLRDGSVRQSLRVSERRMLDTNWESENAAGREAISQAVGRAVGAAGFRGLLTLSAAVSKATNTVLFVDRMGAKDSIALGDAE